MMASSESNNGKTHGAVLETAGAVDAYDSESCLKVSAGLFSSLMRLTKSGAATVV